MRSVRVQVGCVLAVAAALAVGACMSMPTASEKIEIPAGAPWSARTEYVLEPGDRFTVEVAPMDLWTSGGWTGNATGAEVVHGAFPVPGSRAYGLIGRIGEEGAPFYVGVSYEGVADSSGVLHLGMNDAPGNFADNEGSVTAIVRVSMSPDRRPRREVE